MYASTKFFRQSVIFAALGGCKVENNVRMSLDSREGEGHNFGAWRGIVLDTVTTWHHSQKKVIDS